jgi:predicted amidohydrolase YtcJ
MLGRSERVGAGEALAMYLSEPADPGGAPRRVEAGAAADLCLLKTPLRDALESPSADLVAATLIGGRPIYEA